MLYAQEKTGLEFHATASWRTENLNWSIAGNSAGQNPNIYSELKWKSLQGPLFEAGIRYTFAERFFLASSFSYSPTLSGSVTDTDYASDDRQNPTFYALIDADEGSYHQTDIMAGHTLLNSENFKLTAGIGYRIDVQHLLLLDHENEQTGQVNLRSTYDTSWKGIQATTQATTDIGFADIEGSLTYSQLRYRAKADWNLIDAFQHPVSFRHYAKGYSLDANLKVKHHFSSAWSAYVQAAYQYAGTGHGTDELYMASGDVLVTRFNGAGRYTKSLGVGLSFRF